MNGDSPISGPWSTIMPESGSSMAILRWILDVFTFHRGYQIFVFLLVIVSSTETLILRSEVRLRRVNRVESASVNNDKGYAGDQQPRQVSPSQILQLYVLCLQPENVSNFIEGGLLLGPDSRLVYKLFATLYFVFVFDSSENELAMFDLIQVYVEILEKCFSNVCELDIVLNYGKMHTILDEMIVGGQVVETNSDIVMKAVEEISKLETTTAGAKLISKSASLLWG
ncbi:Adaptor protein complex, sigma subunit [Cynara cardunculus var. scolymus]|uniref:Adaptor protein complex, sigma subunit n=1 Tax=Cynara cardunculus var. scolymus TaxID=59895 RepID=A0A103Y5F3_CYNCS|nr:Adaptor protein complex, sigma subunit [Cynara cardunculus var. scolymus]